MRNGECGIAGQGRFTERAPEHDRGPVNSAFRIPHSALAMVRGPETRMASESGSLTTGRFGPYGGRYVPETLMGALEELARVYEEAKRDPAFWGELDALLKDYVGRLSPITETPRLAAQVGSGVVVLLKREDLNHTGAHKINNTLGQVLLARRMVAGEVGGVCGRWARRLVGGGGGGRAARGVVAASAGEAGAGGRGRAAAGGGLGGGHQAGAGPRGRPGGLQGSLSYLLQHS